MSSVFVQKAWTVRQRPSQGRTARQAGGRVSLFLPLPLVLVPAVESTAVQVTTDGPAWTDLPVELIVRRAELLSACNFLSCAAANGSQYMV